jgi:hypothetical protein
MTRLATTRVPDPSPAPSALRARRAPGAEAAGVPRFLAGSPASAGASSPRALAHTDEAGTHISPAAAASPAAALIAAHEGVHRAQFALARRGVAPSSEQALEVEAHAGARALLAGHAFTPQNAAPPGSRLHFDPTPMGGTIEAFAQQEMRDIETIRPASQDVSSTIKSEGATDPKTRVANFHYDFQTSAKGQRGSIVTTTVLDIHYDPNDPRGWVTPTSELKIVQPPEFWKFWPVTISYRRTIRYGDEYGRTLNVTVDGQSRFDYPTWEAVLKRHPDLSRLTLGDLAALEADEVFMSATLSGSGDLTTIVERDFSSMPSDVKSVMLRGAPRIAYEGSMNASRSGGGSLREMATTIASGLMSPDPTFAQQVSSSPGAFVSLELNAGRQYDSIRAYLEGYDALAIARLQKQI